MRAFAYAAARTEDDAIALGSDPARKARYLGGGTNLVDLMKLEVETPELLVDVRHLTSGRIEETPEGGLLIGGSVTNSELAADPRLRERYPGVAQAVLAGASGQLRNVATTAGNLLQRTRCVYFQDVTLPCNKRDPGSGCSAREGDHRNLGVLGVSGECIATHPSDLAVSLVALDATVHVRGLPGARTLPLTELHRLPGRTPERETTLEPGELITAVELPGLPIAARSQYRKVRDRASFAFAVVSLATAFEVVDGRVVDARIAYGGLGPKPWRASAAETALRGRPATAESAREAADAELAAATPLPANAFKLTLARNLLVRALLAETEESR